MILNKVKRSLRERCCGVSLTGIGAGRGLEVSTKKGSLRASATGRHLSISMHRIAVMFQRKKFLLVNGLEDKMS